jgi:hypothetical protein
LILDLDFESTPTEWYFNSAGARKTANNKISLLRAVKLIESASYPDYRKEASSGGSGDSISESWGNNHDGGGFDSYSDGAYVRNARISNENAIADMDGIFHLSRRRAEQPEIAWFGEANPEYTGVAADKLSRNNGYMLRRLLTEVTVFADICLILTGSTIFSELNLRCFQNSHYVLCPGRAEIPAIRAFGNTAALAEHYKGVPSDRFKYVIWEHQYNVISDDVMWEFAGESLAGVVRASKRREAARSGGVYNKCYAYAMERSVKKDYDDIMHALGIANSD